jgi:hypothetical protein
MTEFGQLCLRLLCPHIPTLFVVIKQTNESSPEDRRFSSASYARASAHLSVTMCRTQPD